MSGRFQILMAENVTISLDVMECVMEDFTNVSKELTSFIFRAEE
jgi:hypothetical protein